MENDIKSKELAIAIDIAKNMRKGLRYPLQYWIKHAGHAIKRMALLKDADFVLQNHGQVALHEIYLQDGTTSLTWAIKAGDTEVARWLLERSACPNTCERTRHFLLRRKAQRKRLNAFSHVLQGTLKQNESRSQPHVDTEPQTVREQYQTGLFIAAVESPTMFELLLEFGADINFKFPTGETSLFLAVSWLRRGEGFFKACKLFLERGADPNICSSNGQSPLHLAARWSQDIVALLLSHGADPKARDKKGRTPLDWAAYHENLEVVSLLCTSGADPDQIDNENHAPLYYAAFYGIQPVVKILIEHGANIAQFEEGARDHNSGRWRGTVWKGRELVDRTKLPSRRRVNKVRFEKGC
ncbi:uncharacterized protein PAC_16294 [Phialocephala subalpina]|uniref:Uncharacterized protein n=1 Tax=Phialocephala subalpina TaxID=576137 RepID=A0A1L7XMY6_9HELO|nr:uncharacterized protein PAC_16294 [Phialocephala subalpina]